MIIDNRGDNTVSTAFRRLTGATHRIDLLPHAISLAGADELLSQADELTARVLLPQPIHRIHAESTGIPNLFGDALDRPFRHRLLQAFTARQFAAWLRSKAQVRAALRTDRINFSVLAGTNTSQPHDQFAIHGTLRLTLSGLGLAGVATHDLLTLHEGEAANELVRSFETLWSSDEVLDAKAELLTALKPFHEDRSPEFIYFLTLYHLLGDILDSRADAGVVKKRTGIMATEIWNTLYRFQRDAVLGAIGKLERYGGCILADSVGLGKTYEALAVIKYHELRNDRVLVLCPKKLRDNWTVYTLNDRRNPLIDDRFGFDVLNHTDLSRTQGTSGEINLETLNWGNYDLVVIDESHNFRNGASTTVNSNVSRYGRLMDDIIRSGVRTRVLMLSATPVNNRMNDLKNQVAFITEGQDDAFIDYAIPSLQETLRKAQSKFNLWLDQDPTERTTEALVESMGMDYFKLLDMLTIARSRKHIERYYPDNEIGGFPNRLTPENIKCDIDLQGHFPPLADINRAIRRLHLSAYAPLKYVRLDKREEYDARYSQAAGDSVFKQIDREASLIHLMRVNLLKRLESSVHAFSRTAAELLAKVDELIERLDAFDELPVEEMSITDTEIDDAELAPFLTGNKIKVLIADMDQIRWRQDLEEDRDALASLLEHAQRIGPERDAKLARLRALIQDKQTRTINPGNHKLLVFTASANTAEYLYRQLAPWFAETHGRHAALVQGGGANRSTLSKTGSDLHRILTAFSPRSKQRVATEEEDDAAEIDLLIATDCISEGQNLQDCDTVVNYDIHWNPVRIIQRFGRVDRLGSTNAHIRLVNFWPNMELDEYINLEARVAGRMVLLDISATGEENIIEQTEAQGMKDLDYRRRQLHQLQDAVVDLEDMAGGLSITDLTLNDFRIDLENFIDEQPAALADAPLGLHACCTVAADHDIPAGAIFCLRHLGDEARDDAPHYALSPHYLVHVADDGTVELDHMKVKRSLDRIKQLALTQDRPDNRAIGAFRRKTHDGSDMTHYARLLDTAAEAIVGTQQQQGVQSLFTRGGTRLRNEAGRALEPFELVSALYLLGE